MLGCLLALALGWWTQAAPADQSYGYYYQYISFDKVELPPGFTSFLPSAINDSGLISGTVCDDLCSDPHPAFYVKGAVTVLQPSGFGGSVNAAGTIGLLLLIDPQNFIVQPALFHQNGKMDPIPPQPGEVFSGIVALNDRGTALVESDDDTGNITYFLYSKGQSTLLDFGPTVTNPVFLGFGNSRFINNHGDIAGITFSSNLFDGSRGFRLDSRTGEAALLEPVSPDTLSWGLGINNRGDVLGYSFINTNPYHERIGVWNRKGDFKTHFDETISSNLLVFNDNNLIVISITPDNNSFLVPKPGVRLNLADLVKNMPPGQNLHSIFDINNNGNMLGEGAPQRYFLLERISTKGLQSSLAIPNETTQSVSEVKKGSPGISAAVAAMLHRPLPPKP